MTASRPTISQLFDLSGRVALVTGATGHLGSALAEALAEAGARIVVAGRDRARCQATADALPRVNSGPHLAVALDQMDHPNLVARLAEAVTAAGRIDILINNGHEPLAADWREVTGEQFNRQLANSTGYFLLARAVRDHAVASDRPASIVMLGSMYGEVASYPEAYAGIGPASSVAYHALKGGILQMTRHLAVYWANDRVRVNSLSPGPFPAPAAPAALVERLCARSPMGRMGRPQELKGAVLFLAADASSYVTGHNLVVDGGWTAW
jgi:gluconate 5-dehydrogenase